jgi:hypothetical protein
MLESVRALMRRGGGARFLHLGGLGLVVWYLMTPPAAGRAGIDTQAPLEQWGRMAAYESVDACQNAMRERRTALEQDRSEDDARRNHRLLELQFSRCVASDDPSLKPAQ